MKQIQNDNTGLWIKGIDPLTYDSQDKAMVFEDAAADQLADDLTNGVSLVDPEHEVQPQPHSTHQIGRPNDR